MPMQSTADYFNVLGDREMFYLCHHIFKTRAAFGVFNSSLMTVGWARNRKETARGNWFGQPELLYIIHINLCGRCQLAETFFF